LRRGRWRFLLGFPALLCHQCLVRH
jgi:hypothetical protein